jgi:RNA polymerase sigma factor (sigma-70 family)
VTQESPESLNTLAARAMTGDRAALGLVCRRLQGPVFRLAMRMLGSRQDAEDATQEILVQVITHLSSFECRSELTTWAYTIASRHLLRLPRRRRESLAMTPEQAAAKIDRGLAAGDRSAILPEEAPLLERELRLECTQGMLLCLSRPERLAFILADVLGASDRQGAEICATTRAAFRQRVSRARKQMRPLLAERCGLADPSLPCRCSAQVPPAVESKLIRPDRLRFASTAREPDARLARADAELGRLGRMRHVFDEEEAQAAPREIWERLKRASPELLGDV